MRLFRPSLAFGLVLLLQAYTAQGYYFSDSSEDLSTLESTPGVAIVYPRAMGPSAGEVENELKDDVKTAEDLAPTTTALPITITAVADAVSAETTTTQAPTTTEASVTTTTTTVPSAASSESPATTTASVEANVFGVRASASASAPNVNRLWHFNSQGLNTNSVWFSPASRSSGGLSGSSSLDSEAVESSQSAVRVIPGTSSSAPVSVTSPSTTTSTPAGPVFFRRQPILADENDELEGTNSLTKRIGAPAGRVAFGEYRNRESERNLYYPDIPRIPQSNAAVIATSSSTASASAAAAAAASASTNSASTFGIKGGAAFNQNLWTQSERLTSPAKSVRKVVKTSAQLLSDEKTQFQREPVRVRVVVQKPTQQQVFGGVKAEFQNNYFERLNEASKNQASASAAAAAAASASSSQSFYSNAGKTSKTVSKFNEYANKAFDEKDYVQVSAKSVQAVKSPPTKTVPPPPRPAPVKSYPTKSAVKAPVRKPVFEQQSYERYEQEQPEPEPYSFNWQYGDETGNGQYRREEQDKNGVVRGSYGYTDAWGLYRIVDYVADVNGFRASVRSNEPGLVERNPITNEVDNPAHIKIAAEDTPQKVVELMRLTKPKKAYQQQ